MVSITPSDSFARRFFETAARRARIIGPLLNYPRTQLVVEGTDGGFNKDNAELINERMGTHKAPIEALDQIIVFHPENNDCEIIRILHSEKRKDNGYPAQLLRLSLNVPKSKKTEAEDGRDIVIVDDFPLRLVEEGALYRILERAFRNDRVALRELNNNAELSYKQIEAEMDRPNGDEKGFNWRKEDLKDNNEPGQPNRAPVPMDVETFKQLMQSWTKFTNSDKATTADSKFISAPSSFLEIVSISDSDSEDSEDSSLSF